MYVLPHSIHPSCRLGLGAERIALAGDYIQDQPHLLGSERTGPDLSQEGGNIRMTGTWRTTPTRGLQANSLMPSFEFLGSAKSRPDRV